MNLSNCPSTWIKKAWIALPKENGSQRKTLCPNLTRFNYSTSCKCILISCKTTTSKSFRWRADSPEINCMHEKVKFESAIRTHLKRNYRVYIVKFCYWYGSFLRSVVPYSLQILSANIYIVAMGTLFLSYGEWFIQLIEPFLC